MWSSASVRPAAAPPITPEKVAINLMDGRIADNAGYQPIDVTIQEDGETATSLPCP